jgi:hypothetical protein
MDDMRFLDTFSTADNEYPTDHEMVLWQDESGDTYIGGYEAKNGGWFGQDDKSPTIREIMYACGIASTSNTSYILRDLQEAGKIIILPRSRGIKVTGGQWSYEAK